MEKNSDTPRVDEAIGPVALLGPNDFFALAATYSRLLQTARTLERETRCNSDLVERAQEAALRAQEYAFKALEGQRAAIDARVRIEGELRAEIASLRGEIRHGRRCRLWNCPNFKGEHCEGCVFGLSAPWPHSG